MREFYTFVLDGKFLYISADGAAYSMPLFSTKSDAHNYAAEFTVKYDSIVKIQMRLAQ